MYMVSLPCPPIPVLVNVDKKDNEEDEGKETVCSSHDLLAGLLLCAMQRNSKEKNEKRRKKQVEIVENYISEILKSAFGVLSLDKKEKINFESFWNSSKKFTCDFLTSFDDEGVPTPSIRFASTLDVESGSKVHKACCSWMVAQDILYCNSMFGTGNSAFTPRKVEFFQKLSYKDMISMHHERLVEEETKMSPCLDGPGGASSNH